MLQNQQLPASRLLAEKAAKVEQAAELLAQQLSRQQAELERLRHEATELWAAAGRAILSSETPATPAPEPAQPQNRPKPTATKAKTDDFRLPRKYANKLGNLADRCFEALSHNGRPMLLAQIRHRVAIQADVRQLNKLSRSLLGNALRKAMQDQPEVFKQLGARHWALHKWSVAEQEPAVAEPPSEEPLEPDLAYAICQLLRHEPEPLRMSEIARRLDPSVWSAGTTPHGRYQLVRGRLQQNPQLFQQSKSHGGWSLVSTSAASAETPDPAELLHTSNLAQLCFRVLKDAPAPLSTQDLSRSVLEKFPVQVQKYESDGFSESLTKSMRRKPQLFYRVKDGRWWLSSNPPPDVPTGEPDLINVE